MIRFGLALVFVTLLGTHSPAAEPAIGAQVRAVFEEKCFSCHGPEKQKGGLRLDSREAVLGGGDSGAAILPGKGLASLLYSNVAGLNPDTIMPPKGERLTSNQVALIVSWIDRGAPWPEGVASAAKSAHWAFRAPVRPAIPKVKNSKWVRNEVDSFILSRLESEKIKPSPEADRHSLIRRLSLDLTGLPPKPEQIEAFVNDRSPKVYERLVEEFLGSQRYGEQWARHWLDLARYADTDGYEKDFYRPHAWRWRNWVIDAINRDQPFDEFTRDQLAGDLLPNASVEQKIATGFNRNNLLNREGGVDIEEDRCKIVVDRVSTLGTVWLGLTVGCAECHSHKYDPISQKEFYQLYAFFNSTEDRDIPAPLASQKTDWSRAEANFAAAKQKYVDVRDAELDAWAQKVAALPDIWVTPKVEDYDLPTFGANNGANLYPQEDGSFLVTGMVENKTHYIMMLNTQLRGISGIRVEAMTDEMLPKLGPGWAPNGNFVLSDVRVEAASLQDVNHLKSYAITDATADYSQPNFEIKKAIDESENSGWAVDMTHLPMHAVDRCAVFGLKESIGHAAGTRLKVSLVQHHGNSHTLGRVRVTYTTADPASLAAQAVPQRIRDICRVPAGRRSLEQRVELKRYYQATFKSSDPDFVAFTKAMADAPGVKGEVRGQMLTERTTPRATRIHVRGNFLDKGAEVRRGTLAVLHGFKPKRDPADRIDLADWLVDPANPLTARVTVNHIWRHLFGEGLVATVGDFGTQGDKPSHPELLDWLATEFMQRGWSRKELIRLIVNSAAYRQSSVVREDLLARDAKNRWLARQNRFRLSAENARDQYLAASGLLDSAIGGPSVKASSRRRGMYVEIKRAHIDYMLTSFDAPTTVQSCPKRERSNTPLQALTLMNDPLFVDCARALAKRAVEHSSESTARIERMFQLTVARRPTRADADDLLTLQKTALAHYLANADEAKTIAGKQFGEQISAAEAAAWTVVARVIMNLDEVITRE
ncbi:MAG: PSD1 and planctomycete cytochrome C domain-containing protein [Verrucomicrobia subdivision 3 bacterium]|nr:PSD1 and planctomycete cytochrome C domain-containing protein [Limisphaerales bacterium]